jgi:hypothetical protein
LVGGFTSEGVRPEVARLGCNVAEVRASIKGRRA